MRSPYVPFTRSKKSDAARSRYADGGIRKRAVDEQERARRRHGLAWFERAGGERLLRHLQPAFLETLASSTAPFSTASASRGSRRLTALSAPTFATLIDDGLDRRADQSARGASGARDLEPHLRRAAHAAAGRLDRRMKRQRAGWMADREDRGLAGLEVVAEVDGRRRPPRGRAWPARVRGPTSSATRDSAVRNSEGRPGQSHSPPRAAPRDAADALDPPPGRIDLDRHVSSDAPGLSALVRCGGRLAVVSAFRRTVPSG